MDAALRIFTYLPNPRLAKARIAARLCGLELEIRGAEPGELADWLWDFDARPLGPGEADSLAAIARQPRKGFRQRLYKTDAFVAAQPFGNVPAAFSPDGHVGIFESNSILRAVARLDRRNSGLYGHDAYTAARIDGFLDASLLFAASIQSYVLALASGEIDQGRHAETARAFSTYLDGIEQALANSAHIAGPRMSLADIAFVTELALLHNERNYRDLLARHGLPALLAEPGLAAWPRSAALFAHLCAHAAIAPDIQPYLDAPPL